MSLLPEGAEQARDVSLLSREDGSEAFLRLWALMRDRLVRTAVRLGLSHENAEDVVQSVSGALWERRSSLAGMSVGSFWAYAFRSVKNLARDQTRRQGRVHLEPLEDGDIPAEDGAYVDTIVEAVLERDGVYDMADRLWLGELQGAAERILAVQLCLTEGLEPEESAAVLGLSPQDVRALLADSTIARHAAYRALMWESEDLAGHVLAPERPVKPQDAEGLLRSARRGEAVAVGTWSSLEVVIVILHVRYGMSRADIARLVPEAAREGLVEKVVYQAVEAYPFPKIAARGSTLLRACLDESLRKPGLWRRLVFEYHFRVQLPHKQILERIAPAGACLGVELKETTLNSWIGNGRLWAQIAAYATKESAR